MVTELSQQIRSALPAVARSIVTLGLLAGFLSLAPPILMTSAAAAAEVKAVRLGTHPGYTRVVLEVEGDSTPSLFLLPSPARIVIDFPDVRTELVNDKRSKGLVASLRHGLFAVGVYRFVLDLKRPARLKRQLYLPPSEGRAGRWIFDIERTDDAGFQAGVAATRGARTKVPVSPSQAVVIDKPPPARTKKLIVVDAGHGGVDPGAIGVLGVNEKVITLKMAKAIKKELESTGRYTVRLTRDRDIYIPHRQRFAIASKLQADLFISVHADSIANRGVRGGTVYTLSETSSDTEAAKLAARENKSDILAGLDLARADDDVTAILIELAQRESMNRSVSFASVLVSEMRQEVRMHKRGHRFAGFLVLKAPDVPSILLETGYLTNRSDAALLNSAQGRQKISRAIRRAADNYFRGQLALDQGPSPSE